MLIKNFTLTLAAALIALSSSSLACTGLQLKAKDNSFINGRTVEFGTNIQPNGLIIPRNYTLKGTLPDGSLSMSYQTKYAAVGASTFSAPEIMDGVNEKGLSIGVFYFPGYAQYAQINAHNKSHALSATEFSTWIITQFATVDEVKQGIKKVVIAPTTPKGWPGVPPFHYVVYDKSGKSIVIEPINGHLKMYDNPIGVITNSPTFDWHTTNLSNYINLSPINPAPPTVDGVKLKQFGQGAGMHGLPGDFTPPSRFVRAAVFSITAAPSDTAKQAVLQMFHILNQFDIPVGSVREVDNGQTVDDATIATTVKDPQNLQYYYRTYADQTIRMIDLNKFDLNAKTLKTVSMVDSQPVVDMSNTAK